MQERDQLPCCWCLASRKRYGAYHDLDGWRRFMAAAVFTELAHYYRPAEWPREQQPWLARLWRK
jgi:hypothetical protein